MPGKAIYIEADGSLGIRTLTASYEPEADEILITVIYSGCNPADLRHALELGIKSTVAGYNSAGKVKAVSSSCTKFKSRDLVARTTPSEGISRPGKYGTHQDEIICPEAWAYLVPDCNPLEAAAVITVVARTASDGLTFLLDFKRSEDLAIFTAKKESAPRLILRVPSSSGAPELHVDSPLSKSRSYAVLFMPSSHHLPSTMLGFSNLVQKIALTIATSVPVLGLSIMSLNISHSTRIDHRSGTISENLAVVWSIRSWRWVRIWYKRLRRIAWP